MERRVVRGRWREGEMEGERGWRERGSEREEDQEGGGREGEEVG